ncbi:hypothetical protein RB653_009297 [Dictyostelium firmibasis]|uniref:Uncharacterized protein n=1 Tax=Dictyostelium firmibasis TaxID=79012 RepID=A0AAN7U0T1_9MYCE
MKDYFGKYSGTSFYFIW